MVEFVLKASFQRLIWRARPEVACLWGGDGALAAEAVSLVQGAGARGVAAANLASASSSAGPPGGETGLPFVIAGQYLEKWQGHYISSSGRPAPPARRWPRLRSAPLPQSPARSGFPAGTT